jgi:hypothetical protein
MELGLGTSKTLYSSEMVNIKWYIDKHTLLVTLVTISTDEKLLEDFEIAFAKIYKQFDEKNINDMVQIYDARELYIELKHMKNSYKFANFLRSVEPITVKICNRVFIVNSNYYIRTIINNLLKLFGNKIPVLLVENVDELQLQL